VKKGEGGRIPLCRKGGERGKKGGGVGGKGKICHCCEREGRENSITMPPDLRERMRGGNVVL